jgi:hypothetical protein
MFDQGRTLDGVPEVALSVVRNLRRSCGPSPEQKFGKVFLMALFMDWVTCGEPQHVFAKRNGMSRVTFKRRMQELFGNDVDRERIAQDIVARHLEIAIYARLEARGPLTIDALKFELSGSNELCAARCHHVSVRDTLVRMEALGRVREDGDGYVAVATATTTPLPTQQARLQENACTVGLFVQAGLSNEEALRDGTKGPDLVVTRVEVDLPDLTPEQREHFNRELVDAVEGVAARYRPVGDRQSCYRLTVPLAIIHKKKSSP